jgi:hypothetical protein
LNIENTNGIISIFNILGQNMLTQQIDETNKTIDISAIQKGLYIVILESNEAKQTSKLVIE